LQEAGGIQDQIWAAYGGMNSVYIGKDGEFCVRPLPVSEEFKQEFMNRCIMIYTGKTRKSYRIAESHDQKDAEKHKINILKQAQKAYELFEEEDIEGIAECLGESWKNKKKISPLVSTPAVNKMYKSLEEDGMIGGKLLGTGGSGFIFGILNEDTDVFKIKEKYKSHYIDIDISEKGSVIINE
jgi:D-glycero-alpha-D-manno-heptose-7-phosphate kinase